MATAYAGIMRFLTLASRPLAIGFLAGFFLLGTFIFPVDSNRLFAGDVGNETSEKETPSEEQQEEGTELLLTTPHSHRHHRRKNLAAVSQVSYARYLGPQLNCPSAYILSLSSPSPLSHVEGVGVRLRC